MRVGQRLFVAVLPAVLGVFTVAGLAYWGNYARQAPEWLVAIAAIASIASLVIAWRNTRYVALRIEQLATRRSARELTSGPMQRAAELLRPGGMKVGGAPAPLDELDTIEQVVDRLADAVVIAKTEQGAQHARLEQLRVEYGQLVSATVDDAMRQLEEVRLPLHILLENHFGELNENQEEMLGAARTACEHADRALMRMHEVVQLDLGDVVLRRERVHVGDVMATILASLGRKAGDRAVTLVADLSPTLPALTGDRARLQEAFNSLLRDAARLALPGAQLRVDADADKRELRITVSGSTGIPHSADAALAGRIFRAHGGALERGAGTVVVRLPIRS